MSCPQEIITTILRSATVAPRKLVDLAIRIAVETGSERETVQFLDSMRGMAPAWARAALVERIDGPEAAEPIWKLVVTDSGCELPEALLHRARVAAHGGREQDAASLLQLALSCGREYDLFNRAERVVRKCKSGFPTRRKVRIACLGSSTTSFFRSVVEMLCLRDGLEPVFFESPFGAYAQEILQNDSPLHRFAPEFIVLLLNWRDLGFANRCPETEIGAAVDRLTTLWQAALDKSGTTLIQCSFVPSGAEPFAALSSILRDGRARAIREVNKRLTAAAPDRVILLDCERVAGSHQGAWEDPSQWSSAKIYPATSAIPLLAEHVLSCIRAEIGLSRKLLAIDLDNTVWGGIVGEDGIGGIRLGPPSAEGERYQDLQRYLKGLKERGILLAVVSKNNLEDAREVFRRHESSVLQLDDFVAFKANWNDKPGNIRDLAAELRLGLDSFVFLDDNPSERNAVRTALPDVLVPEISGEPSETIAALERGLYFQAVRLTAEDAARNASYLAAAGQEELRRNFASVDEYLNELQMRIECGFVTEQTVLRVTQLINKTNQFNLTTKRYTQDEVHQKMHSPDHWFRWYRLKDRFADHGLIAVLLAGTGPVWDVDLWLMSCRVIGRGVEEFMFHELVSGARSAGARQILAHYIQTPKNKLVENLLPQFGFVAIPGTADYTLDVEKAVLPPCRLQVEPEALEAVH